MRLLLLCVFCFVNEVYSWRIFHNGRIIGGNLGEPKGDGLQTNLNNYERWFTQNLDHFNPVDERTWQQQALADLATFIEAMNSQYEMSVDVKWIAFGGSYPGSLAAWLRQKYPHLVHGSMSASGPLLAKLDFQDYFKVVSDDLRSHSDDCLSAVKQGSAQAEVLLRHMVGQRNLNKIFRLCDPIENSIENTLDISNLFETLAGNFAGVAQYNKDNRIGKSSKGANITIDILCDIMTNQTIGAQVRRLAAVNDLIMNAYDQKCLDYKYNTMINEMKNISWDSTVAEGDFFVQQCMDIFGPKYNMSFLNRAIERTNTLYGALDIEVSNVVFVHGTVDPWHALGITKTISQGAPAIYIKGE
ncbi:hypothetical protein NQ314_005665 [Rhamnusium bicolor]|uniref:Uncharacterized protein n=1 Tax=Rhamnusium bicolor TaxID=1586634 RepID=A0AAV8ZFJ7_9CUCU|nr:hypothetical protein NQ314_005665 [Rhamnusium bicolor]